ncbi:SPASM domain-containing protein [Clostridium argentinense]|nr:SPASM domain-containing protein [Clostridium argentinense]
MIIKEYPNILNNFTNKHTTNRSFLCSAGRSTVCITYNGDVYPCSFLNVPVGNILEDSFKDIWKNSKALKIIRSFSKEKFNKCFSCEYNSSCNMCLAKNIEDTNNIFNPSTETCEKTISKHLIVDKIK